LAALDGPAAARVPDGQMATTLLTAWTVMPVAPPALGGSLGGVAAGCQRVLAAG
jgi:hypothetical protein